MLSLAVLLALIMDRLLGEPQRWHPLVGFGKLANRVEDSIHPGSTSQVWKQFLFGLLATLLVVIPFAGIALTLQLTPGITFISGILVLYLAIGARSLEQHANAVYDALNEHQLDDARRKTAFLVSRDTRSMNASDMSRATVESVLENGNDAVFATIFWFIVAGIPGVVVYRLINTLDAMWGYKTAHYRYFGSFAARMDDLLNLIPARLTALSYALMGHCLSAIRCWWAQARHWESPNAGPVMAAGAGALSIQLGGSARYHGEMRHRCILGEGLPARKKDIHRAIQLIKRSLILWLLILAGVEYLA